MPVSGSSVYLFWRGASTVLACVYAPVIVGGLAFVVYIVQKLLGKNDHPFW